MEFVLLFGIFICLAIGAGILTAILVKGSLIKRIASGVASTFVAGLVLWAALPIVGQWLLRQMAGS